MGLDLLSFGVQLAFASRLVGQGLHRRDKAFVQHLWDGGMVGWWEVGGMLSPLATHQIAPTAFDQKVGGHLVDN